MLLLLGLNEDEDGGESNGSGKSAIMDGFMLAITGDIYREGVNKDEYIRKGQTGCIINLNFRHSITKETMILHREIFLGNKGSTLDILINEKPVKDFVNKNKMKRSAQEYIYDRLGITKEDLTNFFCIGEGNDSCFLTATDTKQKEVISRFSNYNKVDKIVEKIKDDLDENEKVIYDNRILLQTQVGQLENIIETIKSLKDDSDYKEKKVSLNEQLQELEEAYNETEDKQKETIKWIEAYQKKIVGLKKEIKSKTDILTLNKRLKDYRSEKDNQEDEINEIKEIKSQLIVRSGKMLVCPKCKWQFIPNDNMSIKELKSSKEHVEKELLSAQEKLVQQEENIVLLKEEIRNLETLNELEDKLKIKNYNLNNYNKSLIDREKEMDLKKKEIQNLKKNSSNQKLIQQQETKKETLELQIKESELKLEESEKKRENLNFHKFAFEKQFRNYISNKTIRTIQDIINFYLDKFKVDMQVHILGYTLLKSGEIREKIQIWVIKNGKERVLFKP